MHHTVDIDLIGVIPVVKFKLGNWECHGIVDTGSELTMFSKTLFPKKDNKNDVSLSTIGTSETSVSMNKVETKIAFVSHKSKALKYNLSAFSVDLLGPTKHFHKNHHFEGTIDAIFGADFLAKYQAEIDLKSKTIKLKSK